MAKKSVRNRNAKRIKLVSRLRAKRDQLREDVSNIHLSDKDRWEAMQKLQDLPRDSSPTRRRNRCKLCGRPRAYNRLTGLCRLHMRIATINGMVPGMHKASW
ncbi:30S ribosomal protein S14 [Aquicella siphonis]|uniref:Small ribosomal subunit protein uS14 n=1 Tax=Aquicella siphonis TaxID=254247 RepID=A0A5E4PF87_9COXI|nr:30S ribosomal protein S14 [Aquicella siphonis]VVC75172.1 30S ribosomal protein S14 [Aquicella siphonis]